MLHTTGYKVIHGASKFQIHVYIYKALYVINLLYVFFWELKIYATMTRCISNGFSHLCTPLGDVSFSKARCLRLVMRKALVWKAAMCFYTCVWGLKSIMIHLLHAESNSLLRGQHCLLKQYHNHGMISYNELQRFRKHRH